MHRPEVALIALRRSGVAGRAALEILRHGTRDPTDSGPGFDRED
jgi:hypothetical protein